MRPEHRFFTRHHFVISPPKHKAEGTLTRRCQIAAKETRQKQKQKPKTERETETETEREKRKNKTWESALSENMSECQQYQSEQ